MSLNAQARGCFSGFSKLNRDERWSRLVKMGALTAEEVAFLHGGQFDQGQLADTLIENAIGYFHMPLGVATYFCIDGEDYVIPMVVEETSIVAAVSKTAKWISEQGSISTKIKGEGILGQIQLAKVKDIDAFESWFQAHRDLLIQKANTEVVSTMVSRGGGVIDLNLRKIPRPLGGEMVVVHLTLNSCDAMGANIINQVLEYLKTPIEQLSGEQVTMCILSNLNDQKVTIAEIVLNDIDADLGLRIEEASLFAELDPYRAATHNKGVMNGIDPVLIATGNDWRAVEAGVHAYASRHGQYQAISKWRYQDGQLKGHFEAPIVVGTVGGVTNVHPTAKLCLSMMGISSANHLSRIAAAVGLVQNLGALVALCTDGIIKGHMKLHLDNLLLIAGANQDEMRCLKQPLEASLAREKRVSLHQVHDLLKNFREQGELV